MRGQALSTGVATSNAIGSLDRAFVGWRTNGQGGARGKPARVAARAASTRVTSARAITGTHCSCRRDRVLRPVPTPASHRPRSAVPRADPRADDAGHLADPRTTDGSGLPRLGHPPGPWRTSPPNRNAPRARATKNRSTGPQRRRRRRFCAPCACASLDRSARRGRSSRASRESSRRSDDRSSVRSVDREAISRSCDHARKNDT